MKQHSHLVVFVCFVAVVIGVPGYLVAAQTYNAYTAGPPAETPNCIVGQTITLEAHPYGIHGEVPLDDGVSYRWISRDDAAVHVNEHEGKYITVACRAVSATEVRVYFNREGQPQKVGGYIVTVEAAPALLGVSVTVETEYTQ